MPTYDKPVGFQCSCKRKFSGRPGYYRLQAHVRLTGHSPTNDSTSSLAGTKRKLRSF